MAIRSITQLKTWFRKGAYPLASQFADWMDSYWHKEEKIPIDSVEQLADRLNGKYDAAQANELQKQVVGAVEKAEAVQKDIDVLYKNVKELEAEDERLDGAIADETTRATEQEAAIWQEFVDADTQTLQSARRYTDTNIAVERNDRESGDASTLQAAKEYTDSTAASERVKSDAADRQTLDDAKSYVDRAIEQLVNGSPAALDTLKELSDALGNDPNFAATITNALANKVDKVAGKGLSTEDFTTALKAKLAGIADGANNYNHPSNHPASMIAEDATRRFVTDAEKQNWNNAVASLGDIAAALDKING